MACQGRTSWKLTCSVHSERLANAHHCFSALLSLCFLLSTIWVLKLGKIAQGSTKQSRENIFTTCYTLKNRKELGRIIILDLHCSWNLASDSPYSRQLSSFCIGHRHDSSLCTVTISECSSVLWPTFLFHVQLLYASFTSSERLALIFLRWERYTALLSYQDKYQCLQARTEEKIQ